MEKLLYINEYCTRLPNTVTGYSLYSGLSSYSGKYTRNKVVLKVSLSNNIGKHYLSKENIIYSDYLCSTLMGIAYEGKTDEDLAEWMSHCLRSFYINDELFKKKISELYYVKFLTAETPTSIYKLIQTDFDCTYKYEKDRFFTNTSALGFTPMYLSGPEIYFAINDVANCVLEIKEEYEVEVLSNAKNWQYVFEVRE